jgi:hypothetical protein
MLETAARVFIVLGIFLLIFGGVLLLAGRLGVPFLGRLPGDLVFRRDGVSIYLPLATSLLLSIILTILLNIIVRIVR